MSVFSLCIFFYSNLSAQPPQTDPKVSTSAVHDEERGDHAGHDHARQYRILLNRGLLRPQKETYQYNEPFDLINLVPILKEINEMIPRQFSLASHDFRLSPNQLVIQHVFMDVRTRNAPKNSIISFSYLSGGGYAGARLDVPLLYSSEFGLTTWTPYPLGNYTWTFDRGIESTQQKTVYIRALTRFTAIQELFLFKPPKD